MDTIYKLAIRAALLAGQKILEIYKTSDFEITKKTDESPLTKADKAAHDIIVNYLEETPYPVLSEEGRKIPYSERSQWKIFWLVDPLDGTKEFIKKNGEFTVNIALIENRKPIFGVVYAPVLDELYIGIVGIGAWLWTNPDIRKIEEFREFANPLPLKIENKQYIVVASRSHMSIETEEYINERRKTHTNLKLTSIGSSLKLCMVARGKADEYPRLGPTMEWDVGAAHAVVLGAGKNVYKFEEYTKGIEEELEYNKEDLLNPHFIVK